MPSFAESFWSSDYAAGLGVLFGKLQQGVLENRQVLTIARLRAEAEETYGQRLADIAPTVDKVSGGFARDDGATVRKAYDGMRGEMQDAARNHQRMAQSMRDLVVNPFSRWCDAHEARVQESQDELQARIKNHDRQAETVRKLRATYFNKCRLVEDLEEEDKLAFREPESSPKLNQPIPEIKVQALKEEEPDDEVMYEIGDDMYQPEQLKVILAQMLSTIKMGETKVPILGTYVNTSAGSDIVEYLQRNMDVGSVSYAERIGQDLISNGILRLIGNVGNTFANSSRLFYQWRPKAFKLAGMPDKRPSATGLPLSRTFSLPSAGADGDSAVVGTVSEYLANWNVLGNAHGNETPAQRLQRESREADDKYKQGVARLDELRCELEQAIFQHLKFLEKCELDRLRAIKTVILDFSGTIGNVIPSLQSTVDKMVLFQETVQPAGDLRYLLENYRTGSFMPKVTVYENYYSKVDEQTFGVDLEARARADRKRVPAIVTTLLTYLDNHYPDLDGDEARRGVWMVDVPLSQVHKLRWRVNDGKPISHDVLGEFDVPTVANLLKLYLLELPDSLVSSHVYEIVRTIYMTSAPDSTDAARVAILQQTLSQLRLSNIATLDACMNHFTRLIDLTSADDAYVAALAASLAPCVLRPRTQTSLTMEEKHATRLVRDLFAHKEAIFSELKRMSTASHAGAASTLAAANTSTSSRPRAVSTDESNRKALVEERNRALVEKASATRSRATSPAPSPRGHRRDRSSGGPETRFPIQTSPTAAADRHRSSLGSSIDGRIKRSSLDVPVELDGPQPGNGAAAAPNEHAAAAAAAAGTGTGGTATAGIGGTATTSGGTATASGTAPAVDSLLSKRDSGSLHPVSSKRDSGSRIGTKFVAGRRVAHPPAPPTPPVAGDSAPRGVTLQDKPMDD